MNKISILVLLLLAAIANAYFIGSKNSDKYHNPNCHHAERIKPENIVVFENPEEAAIAGYVPCKVCKPNSSSTYIGQSKEKSSYKAISVGQCQAITKKGTQCKRNASPGSHFCWQHQ